MKVFDNVINLFYTIKQGIKENKYRNSPIFLIQNKKDLDFDLASSQKSEYRKSKIEEMKENQNINIIYKEISLLEKDNFNNLVLDIYTNLSIYNNEEKLNDDVINKVKFNENLKKRDKKRKWDKNRKW